MYSYIKGEEGGGAADAAHMKAIPAMMRPMKTCQLRSLRRFDDQPVKIVAIEAIA